MISKQLLDQHLAYTGWATQRLLDAVAAIPVAQLTHDFHTADKTIINTLAHVFAADRIWFDRVNGWSRESFITDADRDLNVLQEAWPELLSEWRRWTGALDDSRLNERIAYKDFAGNSHQSLTSEIILHVVNHGTHHRGQVSGFLRTLGHTPPPLDLIRFYRGL